MRPKIDAQCELALATSSLKLTRQFYAKYEAISTVLNAAPEIVAAAPADVWEPARTGDRVGVAILGGAVETVGQGVELHGRARGARGVLS